VIEVGLLLLSIELSESMIEALLLFREGIFLHIHFGFLVVIFILAITFILIKFRFRLTSHGVIYLIFVVLCVIEYKFLFSSV